MGVTHKLKTEVIDFIVQSKQDDQNLSCRALSDLVWKKFKIDVSKSSVNSVLKNSQLSSKVGRRVVKLPSKTFILPDFRKKQFFESMKQSGMLANEEMGQEEKSTKDEEEKQDSAAVHAQENIPFQGVKKGEETEPPNVDSESPDRNEEPENSMPPVEISYELQVPSEIDQTPVERVEYFSEKFRNDIENIRISYNSRRSKIYPGVGCIFLLAAKWEMWGGAFWRNIVQFNKTEEAAYEWAGDREIWKIITSEDVPVELAALYKSIGESRSLPAQFDIQQIMSYELEKAQGNEIINAFEITLKNGDVFYLDPLGETIYKHFPSNGQGCGMAYSLRQLSSSLFANNKLIFLRALPYVIQDMTVFTQFMDVCEYPDDAQIDSVAVLGPKKQKITEFRSIPKFKRFFAAACWQGHPLFPYLTRNINSLARKPFYSRMDDRVLTYAEAEAKFSGSKTRLRVLIMFLGTESDPIGVILSNCYEAAEKVLSQYFSKHPLYDSSLILHSRHANLIMKEIPGGVKSLLCNLNTEHTIGCAHLIRNYVDLLHRICCSQYFPQKHVGVDLFSATNLYYKLDGTITISDDRAHIGLISPPTIPDMADLSCLLSQVNRRAILTPSGHQLFISFQE